MLEFSGLSGVRGEIHVCRTTTKRVDWCKHVRNQYIQHCIYTKSCTATPKHVYLTARHSHRISKSSTHPLERRASQARHPLEFTPPQLYSWKPSATSQLIRLSGRNLEPLPESRFPTLPSIENHPLLQYEFVSPENEFNGARMCDDTDRLRTRRHSRRRSHGTTRMTRMARIHRYFPHQKLEWAQIFPYQNPGQAQITQIDSKEWLGMSDAQNEMSGGRCEDNRKGGMVTRAHQPCLNSASSRSRRICVGILGAVRREGRNSRLSRYHETSGLAQTREELVHTTLYIYEILHCHNETRVPHREALAPNIQILNTSTITQLPCPT